MNEANYFEIGTPEPQKTMDFYGKLFGWQFGEPSDQDYRSVNQDKGGIWDTSKTGGAGWAIFYVQVDDVEASVNKAEELGAKVVIPTVKSDAIDFAHLEDPLGNRFAIWKPKF